MDDQQWNLLLATLKRIEQKLDTANGRSIRNETSIQILKRVMYGSLTITWLAILTMLGFKS